MTYLVLDYNTLKNETEDYLLHKSHIQGRILSQDFFLI